MLASKRRWQNCEFNVSVLIHKTRAIISFCDQTFPHRIKFICICCCQCMNSIMGNPISFLQGTQETEMGSVWHKPKQSLYSTTFPVAPIFPLLSWWQQITQSLGLKHTSSTVWTRFLGLSVRHWIKPLGFPFLTTNNQSRLTARSWRAAPWGFVLLAVLHLLIFLFISIKDFVGKFYLKEQSLQVYYQHKDIEAADKSK